MTDRELMQQALDTLDIACRKYGDIGGAETDWGRWDAAMTALRARLAQPEPEPVAWGIANTRPTEKNPLMMVMLDEPEPSHLVVPLYTAPPQREWQGLTDEDIKTMWDNHIIPVFNKHGISPFVFARAIEAKLKEKNG